MPHHTIYVWERTAFGDHATGLPRGVTGSHHPANLTGGWDDTTVTGSPTQMTIRDDDPHFDDWHSINGSPVDTGVLQAVIGDTTVGSAFFGHMTTIYALAEAELTNHTTGETGNLTWIGTWGTGFDPSDHIALATTIGVSAGDVISVGPVSYVVGPHTYSSFICFTKGTRISGPQGDIAVEDLRVGDPVLTMDDGVQPIRWIGVRHLGKDGLTANPKLLPVRIRAGAFGDGLPERDLLVSRQHRMLVRSPIVRRMFDCSEVLIPAIKLVAVDGIDIASDVQAVSYYHILFEDHQVIWSNGTPSESLFTGPEALKMLPPDMRQEIETLFPELCAPDFIPPAARPIPTRGPQMKQLALRHQLNAKPLFAGQ